MKNIFFNQWIAQKIYKDLWNKNLSDYSVAANFLFSKSWATEKSVKL